jgi:hypothetical protein
VDAAQRRGLQPARYRRGHHGPQADAIGEANQLRAHVADNGYPEKRIIE